MSCKLQRDYVRVSRKRFLNEQRRNEDSFPLKLRPYGVPRNGIPRRLFRRSTSQRSASRRHDVIDRSPFFLFHRQSPKGIDRAVHRSMLAKHDAGHDTSLIFRVAVSPAQPEVDRVADVALPVVIVRRLSMQSLKLHSDRLCTSKSTRFLSDSSASVCLSRSRLS